MTRSKTDHQKKTHPPHRRQGGREEGVKTPRFRDTEIPAENLPQQGGWEEDEPRNCPGKTPGGRPGGSGI